jgi:hypothetical protein
VVCNILRILDNQMKGTAFIKLSSILFKTWRWQDNARIRNIDYVPVFVSLYIGLLTNAYVMQSCFPLPSTEAWGNIYSWTLRTCLGDGEDLEMKDIKNRKEDWRWSEMEYWKWNIEYTYKHRREKWMNIDTEERKIGHVRRWKTPGMNKEIHWNVYTYIYLSCFSLSLSYFHANLIKQTPWSESASELYRPSDCRLSAKWLPTFADRGCHVVSVTDSHGRILGFLDRSRYFSIK